MKKGQISADTVELLFSMWEALHSVPSIAQKELNKDSPF
jgi:hypothetical protein